MDKKAILEELKKYKENNSEKYGIIEIGIFGSVATGKNTNDSDIDIFLKTKTPNPFNIVHIKEDLEHLYSKPIDIVRYRSTIDPFLLERIYRDVIFV
jgi:uncharacterized protein